MRLWKDEEVEEIKKGTYNRKSYTGLDKVGDVLGGLFLGYEERKARDEEDYDKEYLVLKTVRGTQKIYINMALRGSLELLENLKVDDYIEIAYTNQVELNNGRKMRILEARSEVSELKEESTKTKLVKMPLSEEEKSNKKNNTPTTLEKEFEKDFVHSEKKKVEKKQKKNLIDKIGDEEVEIDIEDEDKKVVDDMLAAAKVLNTSDKETLRDLIQLKLDLAEISDVERRSKIQNAVEQKLFVENG